MPTLLQINAALNRGSTGRIAEQIGILAQKQGWEVYIAHGARYTDKSDLNTIQVVTKTEEKLHAIKSLLFDSHGLDSGKATKKFVERIKEIKPDIIHLHNIHGYYLNYKILFEYLATIDTPIVWTLHDCWTMTGHCAYFDAVGCEKWKTGCHKCPLKGEYPKSILFDSSTRNYALKKKLFTSLKNATIVPVSQWLGSITKESYLGWHNVHVINNGIDINTFKPAECTTLYTSSNNKEKKIILGVASIWEERKGLKDFIKLRKILPEKYKIILVGLSKKQIECLPKGITGISRTNSTEELARYYSTANVYVNPTYEDNFPTTNLEALACGTPVITYRTGGSPESVTPETGIVVDKGNFNDLAKAIEVVCNKGKEYYSTACRERAVSLYNKDDRFNEYIELYNTLLNQHIECADREDETRMQQHKIAY